MAAAGATYPVAVDSANELARLFDVRVIPLGIAIDQGGRLVKGPVVINVDDAPTLAGLRRWIETGQTDDLFATCRSAQSPQVPPGRQLELDEALARFRLGEVLLRRGLKEQALEQWRAAWKLDPDNWLIRKQIWALEHPEKFYNGPVDFDWQKEQIAAGR